MALHESLGEILGAFQLRRALRGAENLSPAARKRIDDARGQRRFGPDDRQRDLLSAAQTRRARRWSVMSTFSTPSSRAVPALPGATNTLETRGGLRELPGERMLAAAAADDQ